MSRLRDLTSQIDHADPESRSYRGLVAQRDRLETAIQETTASVAEVRHRAALDLVGRSEGGDLDAIFEAEGLLLRTHPALAAALCQARGTDQQLIHVVADMIVPPAPNPCSMCGK